MIKLHEIQYGRTKHSFLAGASDMFLVIVDPIYRVSHAVRRPPPVTSSNGKRYRCLVFGT